jgi:hypothetical protein
VAQVIIKAPEEANLLENVEGNSTQQQEFAKKIADIETNRMYSWSDMSKVKVQLWNKLHAVKDMMKKKATNLAQIISANAQHLANNYMPPQIKEGFGQLY